MANPTFFKTFEAEGVIYPYLITAHGSTDNNVKQATSAADAFVGAAQEVGAEDSERIDIPLSGLPYVLFGGTVQRGDPLTSNADGKAIKATVNGSRIIGFAWFSAVANDIAPYQAAPGFLP